MEDITPSLLKQIRSQFNEQYIKSVSSGKLKTIADKIQNRTATYKDAYTAANEIGNIRTKVLKNVLSSSVLPDGKMYYNIAEPIVRDCLESDYQTISTICQSVQKISNDKRDIGLMVQEPDLDDDQIMGFVNRLSSENLYDDVAWILEEPVKTFDRKLVDNSVKKNADFQHDAGIKVTVTRTADSKCCEWCADLAGDYAYPGVPSEVFMRHDNCRCSVDYDGVKMSAYARNFMG